MAFSLENNSITNDNVTIEPVRLRTNNNEVLLNNFVEKDMQALLRPLNVIPTMFITVKYKICDNFITSNTYKYSICTVLSAILCSFAFFFRVYTSTKIEHVLNVILYWSYITDCVMLFYGYILNPATDIFYRHVNVFFILRLQRVFKLLHINESEIKKITLFNRAVVIALLIYYILGIILLYICKVRTSLIDYIAIIIIICFDWNILYASRLLHLVQSALIFWIDSIRKSEKSEGPILENYWITMFEIYDEILKLYDVIEKTFKRQIVFYSTLTLVRALISVLVLTHLAKLRIGIFAVLFVMFVVWLIKNIVIHMYLGKECENVYMAMEDLKSICLVRMNDRGASVTQRRMCKNIQRLQAVSFKKLSICGLYVLDAAVLLQLVQLLTAYIVVILQFAIL